MATNVVGINEIYFIRSANGGNIFDSIINLSNNIGQSENMQISAAQNPFVVWNGDSGGNDLIYFKKTNPIG
jgi:hypothetical protein